MVLNDLLWSDTGLNTHRYTEQQKTENCNVYRKLGFTFVALRFETVEENGADMCKSRCCGVTSCCQLNFVHLEECGGTRTTSCCL